MVCAKRWRGLSRKGTNRTRSAEKRKNVHLAVSEMERMTVSRRERPDAALAIERRHGPWARRPPRGMRLRHEAAPRVSQLGVRVRALSATTVWSWRVVVCVMYAYFVSSDLVMNTSRELHCRSVATRRESVAQIQGSSSIHELTMHRSRDRLSRCESLDTRVARIVVLAPQITFDTKIQCREMNNIGARDTGTDRAVPLGT